MASALTDQCPGFRLVPADLTFSFPLSESRFFRDRRPPFAQQMQAAAEIARAARQFNENALAVGLQLSTAET